MHLFGMKSAVCVCFHLYYISFLQKSVCGPTHTKSCGPCLCWHSLFSLWLISPSLTVFIFFNTLIRRNNHSPILQMKKCIYQLWIVRRKIHITQGKRENGSVIERRRNVKYLVISLTSVVILGGIWNLWHPKVWYIIFHHMKTSCGKQDENKVSTVKWNKNPFVEGGFCPDTRPSGSRDYSFQGCVLRSSLTDVRQKANAALVLRVLGSFILSSRPEGLQHWMNPVDMAEEKEIFFFFPTLLPSFLCGTWDWWKPNKGRQLEAYSHLMCKEGLRGALRIQASWSTFVMR